MATKRKTARAPVDLEVEQVPLTEMSPADYNPRRITRRQMVALTRSLEEFGAVDPIVINADGTIIGGHQRYAAAKELGWDTMPAVRLDLSKDQERVLNLALNRVSGDWHEEKLAEMIADLEAGNLALTGFEDDEIERLVAQAGRHKRTLPDDDAVPPMRPKPKSKRGDLYHLGEHRLLCGDATDPADFERLVQGETVDMVFTDPPYGVAYQTNLAPKEAAMRYRRTDGLTVGGNDELEGEALYAFLMASLGMAKNATKPGGAIYTCSPSGDQLLEFTRAFRDLGIAKQTLVWIKNAFVMGRGDFHYRHEMIHYGIIAYGWTTARGGHRWFGDRREDTVWEIARPDASKEHPTMKPVEMMRRAINLSTARGDTVIDPFAGSGSTLIAAEATGRRCLTMELDPGYTDVVVKRWEDYTGLEAIKESAP